MKLIEWPYLLALACFVAFIFVFWTALSLFVLSAAGLGNFAWAGIAGLCVAGSLLTVAAWAIFEGAARR